MYKLLKSKRKLNNNGSTILMVIIVVAFILILSSTVISATMLNLKMKTVGKEAKKTFYSAEDAVNEVKAALGKLSMECLDSAYVEEMEYVKSNSSVHNIDANNMLRKNYFNLMLSNLVDPTKIVSITEPTTVDSDDLISVDYKVDLKDKFNSFLEGYNGGSGLISIESIDNTRIRVRNANSGVDSKSIYSYKLEFDNCVVTYKSKAGYLSNITFDGVIGNPDAIYTFNVTPGTSMTDEFAGFSMIAERSILSNSSSNDANVNANAYAGSGTVYNNSALAQYKGFVLNSSRIRFNGNTKVITSANADINVIGNSFLSSDTSNGVNIWCRNIATYGNTTNDDDEVINVTADMMVLDDLQAEGTGNITLKGSYYGYGFDEKDFQSGVTHLNSSAVIVNGNKVKLDLSGLSSLKLAGRAILKTVKYNPSSSSSDGLYGTPESITMIGNGELYLVPADMLSGTTSNPAIKDSTVTANVPDGFFAKELLVSANPVKKMNHGATDSEANQYDYYYFNFKDDKCAAYFMSIISFVEASGSTVTTQQFIEYMNSIDPVVLDASGNVVLDSDGNSKRTYDFAKKYSANKDMNDKYIKYFNNLIKVNNSADIKSSVLLPADTSTFGTVNNAIISGSVSTDNFNRTTVDGSINTALYNAYRTNDKKYGYLSKWLDENGEAKGLVHANATEPDIPFYNLLDVTALDAFATKYGTGSSLIKVKDGYYVAIGSVNTSSVNGGNFNVLICYDKNANCEVVVNSSTNGLIFTNGTIRMGENSSVTNTKHDTIVADIKAMNTSTEEIEKDFSNIFRTINTSLPRVTANSDKAVTYDDLVGLSNWRKYDGSN